MNPFSICLIAKNEEKRIERCLSAASKLDAEIVLVDTGSTDRTKELAAKYTDKIYDFKWCNDFSAARNFSISKATYDWILVLDCDEYVESFDLDELLTFFNPKLTHIVGTLLRRNATGDNNSCMLDRVERLFHRKYYHYEGIIHEQVVRKNSDDIVLCHIPLTVYHDGYVGTADAKYAKAMRDYNLLLEAIKTDSDNPYLYFQLGQACSLAERPEEAVEYYRKATSYDLDPHLHYVQLLIIAYGETLLKLKLYEEALLFENIYEEFAHIADFACLMGLIYIRTNQPLKAVLEFMKALTLKDCWKEDANNNFPRYHIGLIYEALGNTDDAIKFWKSCSNYPLATKKLEQYTNQ